MRAYELIDEIEDVGSQRFPISEPKKILPYASRWGTIDDFDLWRYQQDEDNYLILTKNGEIANYTAFMEVGPYKWMSQRSQTYDPFKGNKLTARVFKELKSRGYSLQSVNQQSPEGFNVWYKHLPQVGLEPKVLDKSNGKIHSIEDIPLENLFTTNPESRHRYCFVMECNDYYPRQNLASVNPHLTGFRNLWFGEYNVLDEND